MLIKLFPILLFTLLINSTAYAENNANNETDWYSVEYIVFENKPLGNHALEAWKKEPFQMPIEALELDPLSDKKAFSPLNINQQQLHGVANRLKKLSSYSPIAHGGWIQPLEKNDPLQAIQIVQQAGTIQLEGSITFHRKRYLHLDLDLQLSEMVPSTYNDDYFANNTIEPATLYRLKETRRIKTSDSHYFDHPRFGVLTIVEKIDSPEAPVSTTDLIDEQPSVNAVENKSSDITVPLNEN